jgi:hypothetical protein
MAPKRLQKEFFDQNINFREIFSSGSHYVLKLVRVNEMLDVSYRVADGNQR